MNGQMKKLFKSMWRCAQNDWLTFGSGPRARQSQKYKSLKFEPLEPRIALSATGLVDVGAQPDGALTDKIVYVNGGHGITGNFPNAGDWNFQRPLLLNMIEDLGNQDQMTFFADYLFRAGATVVPMRPIGNQSNEIVLDNDDVEVTFSGAWSDSGSSIYFGDLGDVPYRFASTSLTETATAEYRPNISEAGFYPVYSWARYGSDRAADQVYRVNYSGGSTEVTVNHRRVGNGLVYLGTYYFDAGTTGSVEISNRSTEAGKVVIADMIRFGNGMGDIVKGGNISGRAREDESGLYWIQWHVDRSQGIPDSEYRTSSNDRTASISFAPRYSEYMNREADGSLSDRVYVAFHSNATTGNPATATARGVLGLYNTGNGSNQPTPNQLLLASTLAQEVNDDLVDQNGAFEHNWNDRGSNTVLGSSFGEINNNRINGEFDATIIETGFHDNTLDTQMIRDPKVRDAVARATYQGLVKYFNNVDGGVTPLTMLPGQVSGVAAESVGVGSVTVSWDQPLASDANGDAATGYMVYGSINGYGFDGGTFVAGGATSSFTYNGLSTSEEAYYFKVVAVNAGGEGRASEVVAALPNGTGKDILIVNGFDRLGRAQNPVQSGAERVRPRQSNSFDYAVQVASAIEASTEGLAVDTASNEKVIAGDIVLTDYDAVIWILGEESSGDKTFDPTEQALVSTFLSGGGKLFFSGSEVAWDLDNLGNGQSFYNNTLRADYVSDDANTYDVQGALGSIFEGLSFSFDDGSQFYNADFPDVISPLGGAISSLEYVGGTGGTAATQYDSGGSTKIVNFAFPFETIISESLRNSVFSRVLDFFDFQVTPSDVELILDNDDGPSVYGETGSWTTSGSTGYNGTTYRFALASNVATAQWDFTLPFAGQGEVFVQYLAGANRTSDTVYQIDTGNGVEQASINQKNNSLVWVSLGTFDFASGSRSVLLDAEASSGGSVVIADAVRIVLAAPTLNTADFNTDGAVDGFDFLSWQRGFGTPGGGATLTQGDGNSDGAVDNADLDIWQAQYGTAPAVTAALSTLPQATLAEPVAAASVSISDSLDSASLRNAARLFWFTRDVSEAFAKLGDIPFEVSTVLGRQLNNGSIQPVSHKQLEPQNDPGVPSHNQRRDHARNFSHSLEKAFAEIGEHAFSGRLGQDL